MPGLVSAIAAVAVIVSVSVVGLAVVVSVKPEPLSSTVLSLLILRVGLVNDRVGMEA